ncbi:MAG TPA: energy transducer TonB [Candidatus Acidoferrum sp.]|nr:energy transducer TonB [Candidatus Acidoferrum sp.]
MGSVSSEQGAETRAEAKKHPLPLEIPVVATGARPGDKAENRELFSEETETVLVFETGGVIRLSAAVAVGQLIFLTNKKTGKEVVAQVLRKRSYRPTACYVELDFTEPTAGFWGVEFPAAGEANAASPAEGSAAAELAEAELTEEAGDRAAQPPDQAEVAQLRNEVEALKSKLNLKTIEAGTVEAAELPQHEPAKASEEPGEAIVAAKAPEESGSYPIRMQLPKAGEASPRTAEFAADSAAIAAAHADEHLLPKPNLDFEQFPGVKQSKPKLFSGKATRSLSEPIGVLVAVVLLLVAAGIGTYRMGWLSGIGRSTNKAEPNVNVAPGSAPSNDSAMTENTNGVPAAPAADRANKRPPMENGKAPNTGADFAHQPASEAERAAGATTTKNLEARAGMATGSGKKAATPKAVPKDTPATVAPQEEVYVPPKLLKAIRSLSPPEALRAYVSGVVTLDTVVGESGRVDSATPVSGPKALYQKAVDTVKEYVYQPATRNGKPVPAHVEVKIQFWYEP